MVRILTEPFSRALIIESPHPSLDVHLAKAGIESTRLNKVPDEQTLIDALNASRAQVLFKRSRVPVTREVVEACPDLFAVQLCCIGDDSVDKVACAEHGVLVFNDPVSNGRSVVELAIGHLIALSRRLYETDQRTHANEWDKTASGRFEILDKELGIVGLGNIGRRVARTAEALGVRVRFYDTRMVAQEVGEEMGWVRCETVDELFRTSDLITVHTSARDHRGNDNEGMLDAALEQLGADRPENSPRIFLNLARGNVHTPGALLSAVSSGRVRRAAVDVYPDEPAPGAPAWVNPYAGVTEITCTPHIGAATQEAQPRIARRVAATVGNFSRIGVMRDCVYAPRSKLSLSDASPGRTVLAVVHSTSRGTKKAVGDAIYAAEASNLGSSHKDFDIGVAYDLALLDRPLPRSELEKLVDTAAEITGDPLAVRSIRQIEIRA